jgi:hypothetical protein
MTEAEGKLLCRKSTRVFKLSSFYCEGLCLPWNFREPSRREFCKIEPHFLCESKRDFFHLPSLKIRFNRAVLRDLARG